MEFYSPEFYSVGIAIYDMSSFVQEEGEGEGKVVDHTCAVINVRFNMASTHILLYLCTV